MPTRLEDVPEHLLVDFDVYDESIVEEVHERLAEIQQTTGLAYCPAHGGYWLATTYYDVYEVIRNDDIYSAAQTGLEAKSKLPPVNYDPPEHTAWRQLLNPLFSPARMTALEAAIRTKARSLLDTFAGDGLCEFIMAFARPLPTTTFLSLMGWPLEDEPRLSYWAEALIVGSTGDSNEDIGALRARVGGEVRRYFDAMITERRHNPDVDDVTGYLLRARYDDDRNLSHDELLLLLNQLMGAGLHTVRGIMGYGMIELAGDTEQRQRLIDDPSLIPTAVEELLRLGVGTSPGRLVTKPVELHGVQLQPGDVILTFLSAANRDPSVFDCPHALQVDRAHNRHVTFAVGRHRCLGSNLARIELIVAFEEILRRIPDFRLDEDRPPVFHHSQVRGVRELPLQFSPSPEPPGRV